MSSEILSRVGTVDEQQWLLEELQALENSLYKTGEGNWEAVVNSRLGSEFAGIIFKEINDAGIDKKKYLRELMVAVKAMKTIKVTIAINPTKNLVSNITEWVKRNLNAGIIVSVETDKSIIGGARIAFNGKYSDYSLKKIWENTWGNKQEEILKKINYG